MNNMISIWFPNNKYPPNTKNYLQSLLLGGGRLVLGRRDYTQNMLISAQGPGSLLFHLLGILHLVTMLHLNLCFMTP